MLLSTARQSESAAPTDLFTTRVQIARDAPSWSALLEPWSRFVEKSNVECGFWCWPEVVHSFEAHGRTSSSPLALVWVEQNGQTMAALPFRIEDAPIPVFLGLWRVASIRARLARMLDFDFARVQGLPRLAAILSATRALGREVGCDVVLGQNCLYEPGLRTRSVVWRNVQDTFLLCVPETFGALLAGMTAKSRQTLKRKVRRAQAALPGLRCQCLREPGEMPRLAALLRQVWNRSWHGRLRRQPPPGEAVLTPLAGLGAVRAYVLETASGEPVASVLGYQWKGTFYDEAPAFDEKWRHLSPGLVLDYLMMEDLVVRDRPLVVDFGFGYNQYKEVFGNVRQTRGQIWISLTSRGSRAVLATRMADVLFGLGKRTLGRTGLLRGIKAKVRSG